MSLSGKVAIVTGGNSGIGKAVVLELAAQGASIVIDYVSHPEATEELEKQLAALGEDKVIGVDADVSKVAATGGVRMLTRRAGQELGRMADRRRLPAWSAPPRTLSETLLMGDIAPTGATAVVPNGVKNPISSVSRRGYRDTPTRASGRCRQQTARA